MIGGAGVSVSRGKNPDTRRYRADFRVRERYLKIAQHYFELAAHAKTGLPLGSAKNRYCGRLGAEFSFFFASWWPTAHPTAAPTKPWWPAKCPATPPTAAPLRQPLASAGMLVSAKATGNIAQLRTVFISIRASALCFTIRAVSFRSAYDGWGDRTIPKVRFN